MAATADQNEGKSSTSSLRERVRGQVSPSQPPAPRPTRQVVPAHLELPVLAIEAAARAFFDEQAATLSGLLSLDRSTFLAALEATVPAAVDRAWNRHPATVVPEPCRPEKVQGSNLFPPGGNS